MAEDRSGAGGSDHVSPSEQQFWRPRCHCNLFMWRFCGYSRLVCLLESVEKDTFLDQCTCLKMNDSQRLLRRRTILANFRSVANERYNSIHRASDTKPHLSFQSHEMAAILLLHALCVSSGVTSIVCTMDHRVDFFAEPPGLVHYGRARHESLYSVSKLIIHACAVFATPIPVIDYDEGKKRSLAFQSENKAIHFIPALG